MGSLESGLVVPLKRDNLGRSSSRTERQHSFLQRNRSRFSRFLFFKKLDYLLWICTVAVFLFFVVIFQLFLPGSVTVMDESQGSLRDFDKVPADLMFLKEMGLLDFGEEVTFLPLKLMEKFQSEDKDVNLTSVFHRKLHRFGYRKPQLALVSISWLLAHVCFYWIFMCFIGLPFCLFWLGFLFQGVSRSADWSTAIANGDYCNCITRDWLCNSGNDTNLQAASVSASC